MVLQVFEKNLIREKIVEKNVMLQLLHTKRLMDTATQMDTAAEPDREWCRP